MVSHVFALFKYFCMNTSEYTLVNRLMNICIRKIRKHHIKYLTSLHCKSNNIFSTFGNSKICYLYI